MTVRLVFVTGAAGFVGRHLCQLLSAEGVKIRALVRRDDPWLRLMGVECWIGDLAVPGTWAEALKDVDYVFHCAGNAVFGNGNHYFKENVECTEILIREVKTKTSRIRRFVFVSTIGAVDRALDDACYQPLTESSVSAPTSDYGRSKLQAEDLIKLSGLPYCILRPAMVVGMDMRANSHFAVFARHAISGSAMGRIAWPGRFSVVHVDDVAAAMWLCARHPNADGMTLFCGGDSVQLAEFFENCSKDNSRIPLHWTVEGIRRLRRFMPFGIKALTLPALVVSDERLRKLGWQPQYAGMNALRAVIRRERERLSPEEFPNGQTVITGAASGLGRALVERLSGIRPKLLIIDRNRPALEEVARRHPHCRVLLEDLGSDDGIKAILSSREWNEYPISELFACAGVGARGRIVDLPVERQVGMFQVNVLARLHLAYAAVQQMVRHQFGRVILVSSSSAFQALPFMGAYAASNAAILFLGEAWSVELKDSGVEMITVCPGGMNTNFQESAGVKKTEGEQLMNPELVAEAIFKALGTGRASMTISARARAMSVAARVLPRSLSLKLWNRLMDRMR